MTRKIGGPGPDDLIGEDEDDELRGKGGNDFILGNAGSDRIYGGGGKDLIRGGPDGDRLKGNGGEDVIAGDDGDDLIWGGAGGDVLGGGAGDDTIRGGLGWDHLFGGAGVNHLYGGKGADQFFLSRDADEAGSAIVHDFNFDAGDRIRLDVDVDGDGRLGRDEYEAWRADMIILSGVGGIVVEGDDTVFALPLPASVGPVPAAAQDGGANVRLAGVTLGGAMATQAVFDYGLNAEQEEQVATNPSRSSDESEASDAPALSANGRFITVVSQFNLDGAAEPPPQGDNSLKDVFVIDVLTGVPARVNTDAAGELALADTPGGIGSDTPGDFDLSTRDVAISADGRYVAFFSNAINLVPADTSGDVNVFVKDLLTGSIRLASDGIAVAEPTQPSVPLSISADGQTVAFISGGVAFVHRRGDGSAEIDVGATAKNVFLAGDGRRAVVETADGELFVVDLTTSGSAARSIGPGVNPAISADGRYVVYDNPIGDQVLRREVDGAEVVVVGREPDGSGASVSADGRFVAFASDADDLVPNDTNGVTDVFVKDLESGALGRATIDAQGQQGFGGSSFQPSLSADGGFVAYTTFAANLQGFLVDEPPVAADGSEAIQNGRTVVWSPVDFEQVALPDLRGDEATAGVLSVGGSLTSDIAAFSDIDFVRIAADADQLYQLTVTAQPRGPSNVDLPIVELRRAGDIGSLAESDDGVLRHWSGQAETLFLVVEANPFTFSEDDLQMFLGDYAIALDATDVPDDTSSPARVAIGDPVRQEIELPGDRDWYRIELEAGVDYRFRMRGLDSEGGTLGDPQLELYNFLGLLLERGQDDVAPGTNRDAVLEFAPTTSGPYFLSAEAARAATGSYTLSAAEIFEPPITAPPPDTQPPLISVGALLTPAQPDEILPAV